MTGLPEVADPVLTGSVVERLRRLVELESPSPDAVRLRVVAAEVAGALGGMGADVDTVESAAGEHVVARLAGREPALDPVLVLTHLDTVHPVGAFDPVFRLTGDRIEGPGVYDMKGGLACMLEALARVREAGSGPRRPVTFLATCDEETGSATSRPLIEELASGAAAALVPEPPLPGGGAKTRRKGVAGYRLEAGGRAAHAGLAPEDGVNAIVELAHQILALDGLADPSAGTTVSVTLVGGGSAGNVIPAEAWASVDVRFATLAEARRVDAAVRDLQPVLPGGRLAVDGAINRPPMERTAASARLFRTARDIAAGLGWDLDEGLAGGASDGSFASAMGTPTLDGIGPRGGGAHARDEHVLVADLARRVRFYCALLETL
jgi:glutamate carboxypeptidase